MAGSQLGILDYEGWLGSSTWAVDLGASVGGDLASQIGTPLYSSRAALHQMGLWPRPDSGTVLPNREFPYTKRLLS